MKIVIDARIRQSSTGRYIDGLLIGLQEIDHENQYLVLLSKGDKWKPYNSNFVTKEVGFPQFSFNPVHELLFSFLLYRLRADVMHFGMTQQPLLYFGRIVTTTHDLGMIKFLRPGKYKGLIFKLARSMYIKMVKYAHWKSKYIIVPTKYVKYDIQKFQPSTKNKIVVTYEAADKLTIENEQAIRGLQGKKYFLYVGTVFPHKNAKTLVDAFSLYQQSNQNMYLIFIGKKERYYQELSDYIKAKKYNNIYILGFRKDEELVWAYKNCTAVVVPSLNEGFGLGGLEAMQYGAPVLSSTATCLPEVYGNGALYFDPYSVNEIRDAMTKIVNDIEQSKDLTLKGYEQVKKYSWTKMAKETLQVYKKAFEKK